MNRRGTVVLVAGVALLLGVPSVAYANAGVPMLAIVWPGMWIALLPIIAVESLVLVRVASVPLRRAALVSAVANAVSTFLGIPLTWAALFGVQAIVPNGGGAGPDLGTFAGKLFAVTVQAPWLIPYESDLYWMIPSASLVLLVPFFLMSWGAELLVARSMLRAQDRPAVDRAVLRGNLLSYGLLACVVLGVLGVALFRGSGI